MPSRMDRYYQSDEVTQKRTSRNYDLYKKIYEQAEYTNIEGIANIEKTNEIDISKIQELLKGREKKEKKVSVPTPVASFSEDPMEEKNYDIREVLNKAKDTKVEDDKKRSISDTQYNILKNIKMKDRYNFEEDEKELKELLHTISKTGMLSKLEDNDLSLDLFSDLKSVDGTMIGNSSTIQDVLKEEKKKEVKEAEMDKSFFTTSVNFSDDDFEIEGEKPKKDNKILSKILIILLFVVVAFIEIFIVFKYIV